MSLAFPHFRCTRVARPNQANELGLYLRTGPFWQDTARTTAATATGDPVKAWDDVSGLGQHLIWQSGNVPTLASGGGIDCPAGGAELLSSATSSDSTWSLYIRSSATPTGTQVPITITDQTIDTLIQTARFDGKGGYGVGGTYDTTTIVDDGTETTRGMSVNGSAVTIFRDAVENAVTLAAKVFPAMRLGTKSATYGNAAFAFEGRIRNVALYSTTDDSTARTAARTFLATA